MSRRFVVVLSLAAVVIAGGILAWRLGLVPEIGRFFAAEPDGTTAPEPVYSVPHLDPGLLATIENHGCVWSGLLLSSSTEPNIQGHLQDEFYPMLSRSACRYLHRAVETWGTTPDWTVVGQRLAALRAAVGAELLPGAMFAEAIPADPAMCAGNHPLDGLYGAPQNCVPSLERKAYRDYLIAEGRRAIDAGIRVFLIGQVYLQDPAWASAPKIGSVLNDWRAYARSKGLTIAVGAQTNHIEDERYLRQFDWIDGPLFLSGKELPMDEKCRGGKQEEAGLWGGCAARLWHSDFSSKAHHVLIAPDWESASGDDMHVLARLPAADRQAALRSARSRLEDVNAWLLLPYLAPLGGERLGTECYGLYPWLYSAAREGSALRDQWNTATPPGPYSCGDEDVWQTVMAGASPSVVPSSSIAPSPSINPSLPPSAKPGDTDGDGDVDIFDYNGVVSQFGRTGSGLRGDLNGNGEIDIFDYNAVVSNFGR